MERGITVVVPTLNREKMLIDCLRDLLAQRHRPLEILVVDQSDGASRELQTLASSHPELISYHHVRFRGLPSARNYGWQNARYPAILYVDDDIRCGPELVEEHLRALEEPGVAIVAGGIDERHRAHDPGPPTGQFVTWTATPIRGFAAQGEAEVDHAPGGNFSVWRNVLERVGGFDESLNAGAALYEETDFCLRARARGFRIVFRGRARLEHLAVAEGGCRVDQIDRFVRNLSRNRAVVIQRHLAWYETPSALGRLALLGCSYAAHHKKPSVLRACAEGLIEGYRAGRAQPHCTSYGEEHRN